MSGNTEEAIYNIPSHLSVKGELRDAKLQKLNSAPSDAVEAQIWWDSVYHRMMCNDGTENKQVGKEYSEFTGADGTNAGTAGLVKAPAATDNTKFLKGDGTWGVPTNTTYTFSTGLTNTNGTITVTDYNKLVQNLSENEYSLAIGEQASVGSSYPNSVALGRKAVVSADSAIQLGYGTNSTPNSFYIGFRTESQTSNNWFLLNGATGKIPTERINTDSSPTSGGTNPITSGGVYTALGNKLNSSEKGANNGVATLDSSGKVPSSQLPSFVDDVIDSYIVSGSTALSAGWLSATSGGSAFTPETGKIYVVLTSGSYQNKTYRWSGSTYVPVGDVKNATESEAGIAKIATEADVYGGVDDTKFITPLKLNNYVVQTIWALSCVQAAYSTNPELTVSSGSVTWSIDNPFPSGIITNVRVYLTSTGETIFVPYQVEEDSRTRQNYIKIEMLASANVAAGTYTAVISGIASLT